MLHSEQQEALAAELNSVIERFRYEFSLTYYDAVGVLEIIKHDIITECICSMNDDENIEE